MDSLILCAYERYDCVSGFAGRTSSFGFQGDNKLIIAKEKHCNRAKHEENVGIHEILILETTIHQGYI
jgi:hypothetical protein